MSFQLVTKRSFDKEFGDLPRDVQRRVADAFRPLAENPFPPGCVKLKGSTSYRIRVGDYRIIYSPDTQSRVVRLLAVGHRREIYR
jgi:mRNA interferase RelE/StbE